MSEETFNVSAAPTIYFYVNKETEQVEYVSMYALFGITVRPKGEDWDAGTRKDLEPYYSDKYEIWSYDWTSEAAKSGDGKPDPEDDESWEIGPVQKWGRGEDLTKKEISTMARLVNDGNYISAEEAAEIPGE